MGVYQKSDIIVIPLNGAKALAGLTSPPDALALGRPVVNLFIDVDIEALGIWVDPGGTAGWHSAIAKVCSDPGGAPKWAEVLIHGVKISTTSSDMQRVSPRFSGSHGDVVFD